MFNPHFLKKGSNDFFKNLLIICFSLLPINIFAQNIQINEIVSSNSKLFDEDGDSPDWFELHNISAGTISLSGWHVSDDATLPQKWAFPATDINAGAYMKIWASDKDRKTKNFYRTFINAGDEFKYITPNSEVDNQWTIPEFDDTSWQTGYSGLGYGDGDDATIVPTGTLSIFLRKKFTLNDLSIINNLILDIDYDDAFVAYINGKEVARANINGVPPAYNASPLTDHEAAIYNGGIPERFIVENNADLLIQGENVLCIQLHNMSNTSSDLTIIPFLSASFSSESSEGIESPEILNLQNASMHTNFKLAQGETLHLYDSQGNLVHSMIITNLPPDNSIGISPTDGSTVYFMEPTPAAANTTQSFTGVNNTIIQFSDQGGISSSLSLSLSGISTNETIRYTLDLTEPDETSDIYTAPISIASTSVVRARVFQNGYIPSITQTRTFLIDANHNIPIISLVTEPDNLFDEQRGIYVHGDTYESNFPYFGSNFWEDWERPVNFALYEADGSIGTILDGGVKIFGGWSRGNAQRSLSIFARKRYGNDVINYPLFPQLPYSTFQSIVLRNSGNDWLNTNFRDAILTSLMDGSDVDFQAHRTVATYLNEQYWGMYNMREKVNEHFLASKHGLDPDDVDLLERQGEVVHGDNTDTDYWALVDFIQSNSLGTTTNYQQVSEQMDVENFAAYQVAQIYFNNTDWPGNNIKFWRPKTGKWRWILYDTDFGFGIWNPYDYQNNTLEFALDPYGPNWPNPPWSTLFLRRLVQNNEFKNMFINKFADELNTRFLPTKVVAHINSVIEGKDSEIVNHYDRWSDYVENWDWSGQIQNMRTWANERPNYMRQHIMSKFNILATHQITVENYDNDKGYIRLNSLELKDSYWSGIYFQGIPVKLVAAPLKGYRFSHWSGASTSTEPEIELSLLEATSVEAHFEEAEDIVINEINYNSSATNNSADWIELYNPRSESMDLSNWVFKDDDDNHSFVLPEGTIIFPKDYLIISRDTVQFKTVYPDVDYKVGNFDFGLGSTSDAARIFDNNGILRDEVNYNSVAPWPTTANGQGGTLELISPDLDNSLPESWNSVNTNGSPGLGTDGSVGIENSNFTEFIRYSNPFTDILEVDFELKNSTQLSIALYDTKGSILHRFENKRYQAGIHQISADLSHLKNGVYFLRFEDDANPGKVLKLVKMEN